MGPYRGFCSWLSTFAEARVSSQRSAWGCLMSGVESRTPDAPSRPLALPRFHLDFALAREVASRTIEGRFPGLDPRRRCDAGTRDGVLCDLDEPLRTTTSKGR